MNVAVICLEVCSIVPFGCESDPMWTCIRCGNEWSVEEAAPNIDDFGVHFICPVCGRRNNLKNIGSDGIVLIQTDEPESNFPSKQQ